MTRVDLPEPDTPVTQVSKPTGNSRSTFLRLLPVAPVMVSMRDSSQGMRFFGTAISSEPLRYLAVSDFLFFRISGSEPWAITSG